MKNLIIDFLITFVVVFAVTAAVTFLYSLIAHGKGVFDWETVFPLAIIFGILFPWLKRRKKI